MIAASGRAFCTNAPPKVSLHWFLPENRPIITSIILVCISAGIVIGLGITGTFVDADKDLPCIVSME